MTSAAERAASGLAAAERALLDRIDTEQLRELTLALVAAAGENPGSTEEATVGVLRAACEKYGFAVEVQDVRSEEHTSELQSRPHLVCRLLLEKKKKK